MHVAHNLHPELVRHAHRMSSDDHDVIRDLNSLIIGLHEDGVWTKLDALCVITDNEDDSLLNIVSSSFDTEKVGTPVFTANDKFAVDGTASEKLRLPINPADDTCLFSEDSGCFFQWVNSGTLVPYTNTANGAFDSVGGTFMFNSSAPDSGGMVGRSDINLKLTDSSPYTGFRLVSRTSSSDVHINNDGTTASGAYNRTGAFFPRALSSSFLGTTGEFEFGANSASGTVGWCAWGVAGGLTVAQSSALHTRLSTYLTSRGAI